MALSTELRYQILDDHEPLPKRIRLARDVFVSQQLRVERKEDVALESLCEFACKDPSEETLGELLTCLESTRMHQLRSLDIQPAVKKSLTDTLNTILLNSTLPETCLSIAANCVLCIIHEPCLENYLNRQPKEYLQLCSSLLSYLGTQKPECHLIDMLHHLITNILSYNKKVSQDVDFRRDFLTFLQMPFIILIARWEKEVGNTTSGAKITDDALRCLQIVAVSKQHQEYYQTLMNYLLGVSESEMSCSDVLLMQINTSKAQLSVTYLPYACSNVLRIFAVSYKKTPSLVLQMFIVLCHMIGLIPPVEKSNVIKLKSNRLKEVLGTKVKKSVDSNIALDTLRLMFNVLAQEEISFEECELQGESGRAWLTRLVMHIVDELLPQKTEALFFMLSSLAQVDLLLLENLVPIIVTWLCCNKANNELLDAYTKLLVEALSAAEKQHRPHKLIGRLIEGLVAGYKSKKNSKTDNCITPSALLQRLQVSCETMHSKHMASLFSSLVYHLGQESSNFDSAKVTKEKFTITSLCELLSCVINASRGAQHNTAAPVLTKLESFLDSLPTHLGIIGCNFSRNDCIDERAMLRYLELCFAWGELKLMLLHYMKPATSFKIPFEKEWDEMEPCNLTFLHNYLKSDDWLNLVAKADLNPESSNAIVKLVGQQFRALTILNIQIVPESMAATAAYLTTNGHPEYLMPSIVLLYSHLSPVKQKKVGRRIAADLVCKGPWYQEFKQSTEQLNFSLNHNITLALLFGMRDSCNLDSNVSLSKIPKKKFNFEFLDEMAISLNSSLIAPTINEGSCEILQSHLEALEVLPLRYLPKPLRCVCALSILAVSSNLEDTWALPARLLIQLLGTSGKEVPFPKSMNYGNLITWLLNFSGIGNLSNDPKLQQCVVSSLLGNAVSSPTSLLEALPALLKALQCSHTTVVACIVNYLLPYLEFRQRSDCKNPEELQEMEVKLASAIVRSELILDNTSLLPAYSSALIILHGCPSNTQLVKKGLVQLPKLMTQMTHDQGEAWVSVLECAVALPTELSEQLMNSLWPLLNQVSSIPIQGRQLLQKLLISASKIQVETILSLLENQLEKAVILWKLLIQAWGEHTYEQKWVRNLQNQLMASLRFWDSSENCLKEKSLPCLDLLTCLVKSKVEMEPTMMDLCFYAVNGLHLESIPPSEELTVALTAAISLINALLTSRGTLILERIPSLQQRLSLLCSVVANSADPTLPAERINQLAVCSHSLEGIAVGLHLYKKDFTRAAPYMIADVLRLFENHTIHSAVKTHLEKYVHAMLWICDEHAELFLLRTLSPASQQLLRSELEHRKRERKFHV